MSKNEKLPSEIPCVVRVNDIKQEHPVLCELNAENILSINKNVHNKIVDCSKSDHISELNIINSESCYIISDNIIKNDSIKDVHTNINIVESTSLNSIKQLYNTSKIIEIKSINNKSLIKDSTIKMTPTCSTSRCRIDSSSSNDILEDEYHNNTSETMSILSSDADVDTSDITFEEFFMRKIKQLQPIESESAEISDIDVENVSDCPNLNASTSQGANVCQVDEDVDPYNTKKCCVKCCERVIYYYL